MSRGLSLALIGFCVSAWAQAPQQQKPPEPAPKQEAQPPAQQQPSAPEPAPIRVQVNEVIVPVTVTDLKGAFVSNLDANDFRVYENGHLQKIKYFSREHNQPAVVGFLLDLSSSTRLHWKNFQDSAIELALAFLSEDKQGKYAGFLATYSTDAELAVDTTTDPEPIVDKIRKVKPGGGSALLDAIYLGITRHKLIKGEPIEPRRVLVIIGDGKDNASKHSIDEVIELAQRNLVTIYCVSTQAFGFTSEGSPVLQRLADETGGRVEYPLEGVYKDVAGFLSKPQDAGNYSLTVGTGEYAAAVATNMFNAVNNVVGDVTTQYILRYVPDTTDTEKQFRNIRIEVNLQNVKVRARHGYYPFAP